MKHVLARCWILAALVCPAALAERPDGDSASDHAIVQALLRINDGAVANYPQHRDAVTRYLDGLAEKDPAAYIAMLGQLKAEPSPATLRRIATGDFPESAAVGAGKWLRGLGRMSDLTDALNRAFDSDDEAAATRMLSRLGKIGGDDSMDALERFVMDESASKAIRSAAASAMVGNGAGQQRLLDRARRDEIPEAVRFEVRNGLVGSWNEQVAATIRWTLWNVS